MLSGLNRHDITFPEPAFQHSRGQGVLDIALDGPFERPRSVYRVKAFPGQKFPGAVFKGNPELMIVKVFIQEADLNLSLIHI